MNANRPFRSGLALTFALLAGCGGQPETVDDANVTNPPVAKAPAPAPATTPVTTPAPTETKPGG